MKQMGRERGDFLKDSKFYKLVHSCCSTKQNKPVSVSLTERNLFLLLPYPALEMSVYKKHFRKIHFGTIIGPFSKGVNKCILFVFKVALG